MCINLHSFLARSTENGPGTRAVLWVQGCARNCPGCFNPATHDPGAGTLVAIETLADRILPLAGIEGLTISGGEPFLQAAALAALGKRLKAHDLGVIVFTGFTLAELTQPGDADWEALLAQTDLLIDGPFVQSLACELPLRGSRNQTLCYLSDRYKPFQESLEHGTSGVEVFIDPAGEVIMTGFPAGCQTSEVFETSEVCDI